MALKGQIDTRVAKLTRSKGSRLRIRNNKNSVDLSDKNSRNNDNAVISNEKRNRNSCNNGKTFNNETNPSKRPL